MPINSYFKYKKRIFRFLYVLGPLIICSFLITAFTVYFIQSQILVEEEKSQIAHTYEVLQSKSQILNGAILMKSSDSAGLTTILNNIKTSEDLAYIQLFEIRLGNPNFCRDTKTFEFVNPLLHNRKQTIKYCVNVKTAILPTYMTVLILLFIVILIGSATIATFYIVNKEQAIEVSTSSREAAHNILPIVVGLRSLLPEMESLSPDLRKRLKLAIEQIFLICSNLSKAAKGKEVKFRFKPSFITDVIRLEYSNAMRTYDAYDIDFNVSSESDAFAIVNEQELGIIIRNLIKNAVEAIGTSEAGKVDLTLITTDKYHEISITDNGPGIPKKIKNNLFKQGFTFGKVDGSGLGLYHAKKRIESWNGKLHLEENLPRGTKFFFQIPKAERPEWFTCEIIIQDETEILLLDDQLLVHQDFKIRFKAFSKNIKLKCFTDPNIFSLYVKKTKHKTKQLYLLDQYISDRRGIEIAQKLGIGHRTIIVTSANDDLELQKKVTKLGAKILPKSLIEKVKIILTDKSETP